jgi:hypothetical protein
MMQLAVDNEEKGTNTLITIKREPTQHTSLLLHLVVGVVRAALVAQIAEMPCV